MKSIIQLVVGTCLCISNLVMGESAERIGSWNQGSWPLRTGHRAVVIKGITGPPVIAEIAHTDYLRHSTNFQIRVSSKSNVPFYVRIYNIELKHTSADGIDKIYKYPELKVKIPGRGTSYESDYYFPPQKNPNLEPNGGARSLNVDMEASIEPFDNVLGVSAEKVPVKAAEKPPRATPENNQTDYKADWNWLTAVKEKEKPQGNGESTEQAALKAELAKLKLDAASKYYSYEEYKKRAPAPKGVMEHWTVRGYARGVAR